MMLTVQLDSTGAFAAARLVEGRPAISSTGAEFALRSEVPVPEYIVGVKYTRGISTNKVLRIKLVTNLGRWSPWYGKGLLSDGIERFGEAFAEPGTQVDKITVGADGVDLKTRKAPKSRPRKHKLLFSLAMTTKKPLNTSSAAHPSPIHQLRSNGLRKKLPMSLPKLFSSRPSLLRLLLEDADPIPLFKILTNRGKAFDASLLDLMLLNEPGDSLARISCERSQVLNSSIAKFVSKSGPSGSASIARLMLVPPASRGCRSVMQLLTDDEILDDVERPSMLRMILFLEDKQDSILRILQTKNSKLGTSITEIVLDESHSWQPSLARILLTNNQASGNLSNFMTDSPIDGRPALAKYLLAGARNSIARKVLMGEREGEYSILRLLLKRPMDETAKKKRPGQCITELLGTKTSAAEKSLLEAMVTDDAMGVNLGRIVFETTCRVKDGLLETFSNSDLPPSLVPTESVLSDQGSTIAHFFLSGEVQNKFSMMRALLVGEESPASSGITSVLRLLAETDPSEPNQQAPLLQIVMDEFRRLFAVQRQSKSKTSLQPHEFLPLIVKLSSAVRVRGKDYTQRWRAAWFYVAERVLKSASADATCTVEWKKLAPSWAKLCQFIGRRKWSMFLVRIARIGIKLDQGHGNRFMITQRAVSKVAKAGVSTYFGVSKGIVNAVSSAMSPIPMATDVLGGVHSLLAFAEDVTQGGIDIATDLGLEATSAAMKIGRKPSKATGPSSSKSRKEEDEIENGAIGALSAFGGALIDDDDDDDYRDDSKITVSLDDDEDDNSEQQEVRL